MIINFNSFYLMYKSSYFIGVLAVKRDFHQQYLVVIVCGI